MHQPVDETDHEAFRSLPYDQEKRLADRMENEVIQEMKTVVMFALDKTLAEGHAPDTAEYIKARFVRHLDMAIIGFYNAKHAMED